MGRFIDLTGRQFGNLTVINLIEESRHHVNKRWMCRCDCGTEIVRDGRSLMRGLTKGILTTCGKCIERKNSNLEGKRFGRLAVLKKAEKSRYWECHCDCGTQKAIDGYNLLKGITNSCGCISRERLIERNKANSTHNMRNTRLYHIWDTMKARCLRPISKDYKNYGARGITICEEWRSQFEDFYQWAMGNGYQSHLTLDRIDVNGNYEPSNCRWATAKQQGNNTRFNRQITINGETKTIAEWSEISGIGPKALRYRVESGWNEKDLLLPVGVQKVYITVGTETKTIKEWSKEKGISETVISKRYKAGIRGEDLFEYKRKVIQVEIGGVTKSLAEWSKETGIDRNTLWKRYNKGLRGNVLITLDKEQTIGQLSWDL
jgi:dimeric dUTPase (all-alpha-NTP-PPase superfamily)